MGYERLREIADPALALERTRENWRKLGRSEKWITQRMTGQETRNKLTDYWAKAMRVLLRPVRVGRPEAACRSSLPAFGVPAGTFAIYCAAPAIVLAVGLISSRLYFSCAAKPLRWATILRVQAESGGLRASRFA